MHAFNDLMSELIPELKLASIDLKISSFNISTIEFIALFH
jgi:hypothetical protein